MLHSAASLTFHADGSGEPFNTNVCGTQNVLDLCADLDILDLHYVSTAYVCGLREERILEDDLDFGQAFRNDYEQTKLEAEKLVRAADFLDHLTVYRPAVIAGDSRTGYTSTYHGLYMYLKLMSVLVRNTPPGDDGVRHTPVRLEMTGDERRNIIPVDWVSAVMCHLIGNPEARGKTFHLAPESPLTPRQTINAGYKYFNSRGVEFVGPALDVQRISDMDHNAHANMGMYKEYEASDPVFDLTNLQTYAGHLPCPLIDDAMLHRFWKYGEDDRWGKRKAPQQAPCENIGDHCAALMADSGSNSNGHALHVNLRVFGPGGGDWRLSIRGGRLLAMERGWALEADASFEIESDRFLWLRDEQEDFPLAEVERCLTATTRPQHALAELCSALFGVTVHKGQAITPTGQVASNVSLITQMD
jgi:nucleoside-diphosphate-sugar epimerase